MKKDNFRFEGISIPIKFITVHPDKASFLAQGKKQFFRDKSEAEQERLLNEMYKQGMDIHNENEAEAKADDPAEKYRKLVKDGNTNRLQSELKKRKIEFSAEATAEDLIQLLVNDDAKPPVQ